MGLTRILFVRHGERGDRDRLWQHGCPGLTDAGQRQAAALSAALSASQIDCVVSSMAARAHQTAEAVAAAHGLDVERTCALCEMHPGEAEGMTPQAMGEAFGPHYGTVPGAEHFPDWLPGAVDRLHALRESWAGRSVVAVTHTAVLHAALVAFGVDAAVRASVVRFGYCSITEWTGEGEEWRLERLADDRHLPGPGPGSRASTVDGREEGQR